MNTQTRLSHILGALAATALLIALPTTAAHGSDLVEVTFSGVVTDVDAGSPFGTAGVSLSDPVSGSILYDTATPVDPMGGAEPIGFGPIYFPGIADGFTISVGPFVFSGSDYFIGVSDGGFDVINFSFGGFSGAVLPSDGGVTLDTSNPGNVIFFDGTGSALSGTDLPTSIDPGAFDDISGELLAVGGATVLFSITDVSVAIVPEPASATIVAAALALLAAKPARRRWTC
ncbi:MAG: hypothetical protein AAGF31_01985 [Planctomycetota bacterium]